MPHPDDESPPTLEQWINRLTRAGYDLHSSALGSTARGSWNGNHPMPSLSLTFDPTKDSEWLKAGRLNRCSYQRVRLQAYCSNASGPFTVYAMGVPVKRKTEVEVDYASLPDLR